MLLYEKCSSPLKMSKRRALVQTTLETFQKKTDEIPEEDADDMDNPKMWEDEIGGTWVGEIYIPPPTEPHCSTESSGSRLMITKIVNVDFKSYAGKIVLGPFHYCFSAIIGPNGSGKSNVIDSILFVFGYRANKVRAKKLSAMIHSSAAFPDVQSCSVEMHFAECNDTSNKPSLIPETEFTIGRTAFKDNTSFYTINQRQTKFKDVADLLKKYKVDLRNNRFLILQGEVEQIAMMKSKAQNENETGMLEYLEDIIGTNRYCLPLTKLNFKVEELTIERTEKHNRCSLAERDMKDLEDPHNENLKFLKAENDIIIAKSTLLQRKIFDLKKKLKEITKKRDEVENDLKMHDESVETMKKARNEKEALVKEETIKHEKLVKTQDDLDAQFKKNKKNQTEVQATLEALNKGRKDNKTQLQKLEEQLEELKHVPEKNLKEIDECERKIEKLTSEKVKHEGELQENYASLEERTRPLVIKKESLVTELQELQTKFDQAKADLALVESELKILKSDETSEKRKFENFRISFEESNNDLNEKKKAVEEFKEEIPEFKTQIDKIGHELQQNKTQQKALYGKLMALKSDINEKVQNMQSSKSNNKVLNALISQKNDGNIPGILGRLGDLGGIDRKFDVAISTCCARLDNIVVDCINTAQVCIEYLRRNDLGRATFIALDKVSHLMPYCNQRIQTPENVPRLFDLIQIEDDRVRPAFYFSLRNTLVSKDLDQGTRIAYGNQRFRVVTLAGEVIETSGTMSGGGKTQFRGKMGEQVQTKTGRNANTSMISQKDIDTMNDSAVEMQNRINCYQEEEGRLESELRQIKQNLQLRESELNKLQVTVKSLEAQMPKLEIQMKQQKVRMQKTCTDVKKVQALEEKIIEKKHIFEEADLNKKSVNDKIEKINLDINKIHGDVVKSVQAKINSTSKQITTLKNNVSKLKVQVSTSERNLKKTEAQIENTKHDINKSEKEIVKLADDRTRFEEELTILEIQLDAAKQELESASKGSSDIQKEILSIQKKESDAKLLRLEIEKKFTEVKEEFTSCKNHIPQIKKQIDTLHITPIPAGCTEEQPLIPVLTDEELEAVDKNRFEQRIEDNYNILGDKKANVEVINDYLQKRDVYMERVKILEDITNKRNSLRNTFEDVRKKRFNEFMRGFGVITRRLKEMYRMITQGGDAELELVDSMDPFNEGVSFIVRPNKKSWKNISNLSGGEKTLASLALVFALHYYKPSPLYFMDEIDAALDFKNISIVAHYIKERTKNAQFIIISLRSNMFELSDYLIGIYKVKDCTETVCIRNTPPEIEVDEESVVSDADEVSITYEQELLEKIEN
ncbi:SMC4 family protein [Megaselia abdita]